jgi:hypothetical protein
VGYGQKKEAPKGASEATAETVEMFDGIVKAQTEKGKIGSN